MPRCRHIQARRRAAPPVLQDCRSAVHPARAVHLPRIWQWAQQVIYCNCILSINRYSTDKHYDMHLAVLTRSYDWNQTRAVVSQHPSVFQQNFELSLGTGLVPGWHTAKVSGLIITRVRLSSLLFDICCTVICTDCERKTDRQGYAARHDLRVAHGRSKLAVAQRHIQD